MPYPLCEENISFFAITVIDIYRPQCYTFHMKHIIKSKDHRVFENRFYDFKTNQLLSPVETQNYTVIQVAESHYNHGFVTEDHRQICHLELTFSLLNGLMCSADGRFEKLEKHGVYLSFQGEHHSLKSRKSASFWTLAVNFKDGPCQSLLQAIRAKGEEKRAFSAPELFSGLEELIQAFRGKEGSFFEVGIDSLITAVLVKLARPEGEAVKPELPTYDEKLEAMRQYLDTQFLQLCSLEEISFGYSYSYISKAFQKAYGITPRAYLLARKMDYAANLLREGARLEEIAERLGYSSPFNFSRAFKKHTGLSPNAYRRQDKR